MSRPSVAELRAVCQPPTVVDRPNAEHWIGSLYMRRVSLHATRALLPTGISANGVTWLMVASGLLGAVALAGLPGFAGPLVCALLVQVQLLFDCSDGEVARWRRTRSAVGIYLDKVGHHSTEGLLPAALGVHADGGFDSMGGWTTLGLLVGVLHLLNKGLNEFVVISRLQAGLPERPYTVAGAAPRAGALRRVRSLARFVPLHRAFHFVEQSLLVLLAGVVDLAAGDLAGSRGLLVALVPVIALTLLGHLAAVVSSDRLR